MLKFVTIKLFNLFNWNHNFFPGSLTVLKYLIFIFFSFTKVAYRVTRTETIPPLGSLTFCACLSGACAAVRDDGAPGGAC